MSRPARRDIALQDRLEALIRERREVGDSDDDVRAVQIARRIVVSYGGEAALRQFIRMLEEGRAGTEIAKKFDVTRQRANQWKEAIGVERRSYELRPVLRRIIAAQVEGDA